MHVEILETEIGFNVFIVLLIMTNISVVMKQVKLISSINY